MLGNPKWHWQQRSKFTQINSCLVQSKQIKLLLFQSELPILLPTLLPAANSWAFPFGLVPGAAYRHHPKYYHYISCNSSPSPLPLLQSAASGNLLVVVLHLPPPPWHIQQAAAAASGGTSSSTSMTHSASCCCWYILLHFHDTFSKLLVVVHPPPFPSHIWQTAATATSASGGTSSSTPCHIQQTAATASGGTSSSTPMPYSASCCDC